MTYIYIANTPEDNAFAQRLCQDLQAANLQAWYDDGQAEEATLYAHLQKATHLIAILSPTVGINEKFLGALEFAKQHKLERLAIRIQAMDRLPPQLQGVLPLNCTTEADYPDTLETLLEDLNYVPPAPKPTLPEDLMNRLHDSQAEVRHAAILDLREYRHAEGDLKELAEQELSYLVFRERDNTLKALITATLQLFNQPDEALAEPDIHIPTKAELAERSEGHSVVILPEPTEVVITLPKQYLWQSPRWNMIWGVLSILLAIMLALITQTWASLIPIVLVGLSLPQFNITIRHGGALEWKMPAPIIGNVVLALLIGGLASLMLGLALGLGLGYFLLNGIVVSLFAVLIGWLSALEL